MLVKTFAVDLKPRPPDFDVSIATGGGSGAAAGPASLRMRGGNAMGMTCLPKRESPKEGFGPTSAILTSASAPTAGAGTAAGACILWISA